MAVTEPVSRNLTACRARKGPGQLLRGTGRRREALRIVPNLPAVIRRTGALMLGTGDEWDVARSFMLPEAVARTGGTQPVGRPS